MFGDLSLNLWAEVSNYPKFSKMLFVRCLDKNFVPHFQPMLFMFLICVIAVKVLQKILLP